jgi:hypothetical protein
MLEVRDGWMSYRQSFRKFAKNYTIPGKLDVDEIADECLLLSVELIDRYPEIDPFSEEFAKILWRSIYNRIMTMLRYWHAGVRDYRRDESLGENVGVRPSQGCCDRSELCCRDIDGPSRELWEFLTDSVATFEALDLYNRGTKLKRSRLTLKAVAEYLGWTVRKVRYQMRRLRQQYAIIKN